METLTSVLVATVLTLAVGLLLGILSARSNAFSAGLRPLLDKVKAAGFAVVTREEMPASQPVKDDIAYVEATKQNVAFVMLPEGTKIEFVEMFEISEYARPLDAELRDSRWVASSSRRYRMRSRLCCVRARRMAPRRVQAAGRSRSRRRRYCWR